MTNPHVAAEREHVRLMFEKWAIENGHDITKRNSIEDDVYLWQITQALSDCWQAAFEAGRSSGLEQAAKVSEFEYGMGTNGIGIAAAIRREKP